MPALHIRKVEEEVVEALKRQAARNHRSLEGELREVLQAAAFPNGGPKRPAKVKLRLSTVSLGSASSFGRDEIYGDEE